MSEPCRSNLYGTGLQEADWRILKEAVLAAAFGAETPVLPPRLQQHPVGVLLASYRQEARRSVLDKAARLLTGQQQESWQLLMKSG
ncbi:hypothetical protein FMZ60_04515 [Alcaligenaceae bacterium SJ-26]|nr:hypothetical protein FMZ60_04515 [Alcaligenaceae bacterium SJ-26]